MSDLPQTVAEALDAESQIAEKAKAIREEAKDGLTSELFLALWPLLREPIQPAFIRSIPKLPKGKPYPSTGVSSVQVQIERMDAVLTPLWWWYEDEYALDGKLCTVTVFVGDRNPQLPYEQEASALAGVHRSGVLLARSSKGGVQQGSSTGNIYKGSWTNAAKLAFARVGPGHEVYVGATDLDPDVSQEAAAEVPADGGVIGKELAAKLVTHAWEAGEKDRLQLAASKLAERDVGDCSTKAKATEALTGALTFSQAEALDQWLLERKASATS